MLRDLFSLFPAYAGVILRLPQVRIRQDTFPRIRGGDPNRMAADRLDDDFSPHTRG